ncbi:cytochrome b/b6 domain-containing protein [Deltaproteobacteria bacterium OttesenSCG-928-M10]|nr:cytochrome b/b6 domain-containing protein [Deltaproteobacteria bacterium OttesenSCG-928-M10]
MPNNGKIVKEILDTASSPVAKMRLYSGGVAPNNLLDNGELVAGQKSCLACGNCIDACPVVLREADKIDFQADRNSLHLEEVVGDSCIRCYNCVKACPQVDRPIKMMAVRNRLPEMVFHWWMVVAYVMAATTGILLYHFRGEWDPAGWFSFLVIWAHKTGAAMWLLTPFLFLFLDRSHFVRTIRGISSFGPADLDWWKARFKFWFGGGQRNFEGEYNSGQKTWYYALFGAMLIMGVTGLWRWIAGPSISPDTLDIIRTIHVFCAYFIDISVLYHLGRKFFFRLYRRTRHIVRDSLSAN